MDIGDILSSFDNTEKQALPSGYTLLLHDLDDVNSDIRLKYKITDVLGQGGSSIVYRAERIEQVYCKDETLNAPHIQVIKEYYPSSLASSINREKDGSLSVSTSAKEEFEKGRQRFLKGYVIHSNMERIHQNQTITPVDLLSGNNTEYIVLESTEGIPLNKCCDEINSLSDIAEIMIHLSQAIRKYHKTDNRYVHLDIKPANILKVKKSNMVFIFDYDSIQKIEDIHSGKCSFLSYSSEWAAPEQRQSGRNKDISEATDLFSIGAVFFWLINNRALDVNSDLLIAGRDWDVSPKNRYLRDVDPRCIGAVKKIFSHTLQPAPSCRCQDIDELIPMFLRLQELSNNNDFFNFDQDFFEENTGCFSEELMEMRKKLDINKSIIIPSKDYEAQVRIVKEYLKKSRKKYHTVYWLPYNKSMMKTIISELSVENSIIRDDMSDEAMYGYIMQILHKHDSNSLFVIDGYTGDIKEDRHFNDISNNGDYHLIVLQK